MRHGFLVSRVRYFAGFRTAQLYFFLWRAVTLADCMSLTVRLKKFEGVKNQRNSLLFSYYKHGFSCLEHNLFSRCFDLKDY